MSNLTLLDDTQEKRRRDMMRWLLIHGREWVGFRALDEFPFRLNYAEDGLLQREEIEKGETTTVRYRITDDGVALIGEQHDAV